MEQELKTLKNMLNLVCELMEHYSTLKGETDFGKLIADERYAALVSIQLETFSKITRLEEQNNL